MEGLHMEQANQRYSIQQIFWLVLLSSAAVLGCAESAGKKEGEMATTPVFTQTLYIAAPAEEVWHAIVDREIVNKYHLIPLRTVELRKGGRIIYGAGEEEAISGEVLEIAPGKKLVHSFNFSHNPEDPPSAVTYESTPMGKMCKLVLTHNGFSEETATYRDICGGWPTILSGLKTLLETGKGLPWPQSGE